jgi:hypothetical protein
MYRIVVPHCTTLSAASNVSASGPVATTVGRAHKKSTIYNSYVFSSARAPATPRGLRSPACEAGLTNDPRSSSNVEKRRAQTRAQALATQGSWLLFAAPSRAVDLTFSSDLRPTSASHCWDGASRSDRALPLVASAGRRGVAGHSAPGIIMPLASDEPPEAAYVIPRPREIAVGRRCAVPGVHILPLGGVAATAAAEIEANLPAAEAGGGALRIVIGLVEGDGLRYIDDGRGHHLSPPPAAAQRLAELPNCEQAYAIGAHDNESNVLHVCALDQAGLFYGALTLVQLCHPALAAAAAASSALFDLPLPHVLVSLSHRDSRLSILMRA